jgi:hypothetical protein
MNGHTKDLMNIGACAHLHVEYHTLRNLDGITIGWWQCDDCETKFVPESTAARLSNEYWTAQSHINALYTELDTFHKHEGFVYIFPRWIRKYLIAADE